MAGQSHTWSRLASAVGYPEEGWTHTLACAAGTGADVQVEEALGAFGLEVAPLSLRALQQAYVEAFDLDPASTLDIGWHLFGDGPDRGMFLLFVREALERAGVAETGELPDHLGHLLRLLGRESDADAADLARLIAPAVGRVRDGLVSRRSPYRHVLAAIHRLLEEAAAREEVHP
ncbi:MAG: nitrate reductase molybdenum cofactor assembly chaperone [Betaproteobacteria bacterium]